MIGFFTLQEKISRMKNNELQDLRVNISMSEMHRDDKEIIYKMIDERCKVLELGNAFVEVAEIELD